ncbi:unnamed protein product, partial [Didymodactylos carnosus]
VDVEESELVSVHGIVIVDADEKETVELLLVKEEDELIKKRSELLFDLDEQ